MQKVERVIAPMRAHFETVTDTKFACALITQGAPISKIWTFLDEKNPKSTGGTGHFLFESNMDRPINDLRKVWDSEGPELDELLTELLMAAGRDPEIGRDALLRWGKKLLSNYQRLAKFFRDEAEEFVVDDGEITYYERKDARRDLHFTPSEMVPRHRDSYLARRNRRGRKAQ